MARANNSANLNAVDPNKKFGVLRSWATGPYLVGGGTSMMGDSIEHVLSYWVLWETFHSPALVGFQLLSHWTPFLLLSTWAGALAERYDCRRIIQISQALFISVSLAWGTLFLTGSLQLWHAVILLVLHGLAGALWGPAEQMMLYDFAGPEALPSAIRINATFRSLGFLLGPVVGSGLLLTVGAGTGMFVNVAFYLPLTLYLMYTPFTGHRRSAAPRERVGLIDSFKVLGTVRRYPAIFAVLLVAALFSVTVGAVLQNVMPTFANIFTPGREAEATYGLLMFVLGSGAVIGGFLLEATGWVPARLSVVLTATVCLGLCVVVFSLTTSLGIAIIALVGVGISQITNEATGMAIVQLQAPKDQRGRVIGSYAMFGPGMRTFSGITVGFFGSLLGIPLTVLLSGVTLAVGTLVIGAYAQRLLRVAGTRT